VPANIAANTFSSRHAPQRCATASNGFPPAKRAAAAAAAADGWKSHWARAVWAMLGLRTQGTTSQNHIQHICGIATQHPPASKPRHVNTTHTQRFNMADPKPVMPCSITNDTAFSSIPRALACSATTDHAGRRARRQAGTQAGRQAAVRQAYGCVAYLQACAGCRDIADCRGPCIRTLTIAPSRLPSTKIRMHERVAIRCAPVMAAAAFEVFCRPTLRVQIYS
jgi:hypothetical protein